MKSAAQWEKEYFSQPSDYPQGIAVIRAKEIQAIQADVLRHAALIIWQHYLTERPKARTMRHLAILDGLAAAKKLVETEAQKLEAKP